MSYPSHPSGPPSQPYGQAPYAQNPDQPGAYDSGPYNSGPYNSGPYNAAPYNAAPYNSGQYNPDQYRPPGAPAPADPRPRPSTVTAATTLMFVRAGLMVLSSVLGLFLIDDIRRQAGAGAPPGGAEAMDTIVTMAAAFGMVLGLILVALYVALAVMVGKGHNWARIVAFVLGGVFLLFAPFGWLQPAPLPQRVLAIVLIVIDIAVIVLLALRPSNDYFSPRRFF